MKSYLLLRDNKQSGPFTFEEMIGKGLKAYDLVWVEGKSAAWRYPGELEEFVPYAPPVEEQPFDRFFKRPYQQQNSQSKEANSAVTATIKAEKKEAASLNGFKESEKIVEKKDQQVKEPSKEKPTVPKFPKYVSVSLPSGKANSSHIAVVKKQEPVVEEKKNPVIEEKKVLVEEKKIIADELPIPEVEVKKAIVIEEPISSEEHQFTVDATKKRRRTPFIQAIAVVAGILSLVAVGVLIGLSIASDSSGKKLPAQYERGNTASNDSPAENTQTSTENEHAQNTAQLQSNLPAVADSNRVATQVTTPAVKTKKQLKAELKSPVQEDTLNSGKLISLPSVSTVTEKESNPEHSEREQARKNIAQLISLEVNPYKVGMFGGISDLQLTVKNNSSYPIDLVVVEVKYIQSNKKIFKTETIQFRNIEANSFMSKDVPKTNKGIKVESKITYIASKELDLSFNVRYQPNEQAIGNVSTKQAPQDTTKSGTVSNNGPVVSDRPQPTKSVAQKKWSHRTKGAVIGAGSGAILGAVIVKKNRPLGAVIGGVIGGGIGYGKGKSMDKKDGSL